MLAHEVVNFHFGSFPAELLAFRPKTNASLLNRLSNTDLYTHSIAHLNCHLPQPQNHILKMDIRLLHPSDIPHVQTTNITNLPENYFCKYYMYHQLSWPQLSYVAVDVRIAGASRPERATSDRQFRSQDPRRHPTMPRRS